LRVAGAAVHLNHRRIRTMTVKNNCIKICEGLRRRGFDENSEATSIIPEDAVINVIWGQKWSPLTQLRYLGKTGYLVEFGYLEVVGDKNDFKLTGEDQNE
jgi:hypothetical protein